MVQEKGFDRSRLEFFPLGSRKNKLLADQVMLGPASPVPDPGPAAGIIEFGIPDDGRKGQNQILSIARDCDA